MTGLLALQSLVKKYEFEMDDERMPLFEIMGQAFNTLGNLINQVINLETDTALHMLYLICKIFYLSNQLQIIPFLAEGHNLDPWI